MKYKIALGFFLLAFAITGCGTSTVEVQDLHVEEPKETKTLVEPTDEIPTNTPEVLPTALPTSVPTSVPEPTTPAVTFDPSLTYCMTGRLDIEDGPQQLPRVEDIYWEVEDTAFGPIQKLMGSTTAIYSISPTPHQRWVMVAYVWTGLDNWVDVSRYLVDTQENDHWVVSAEGISTFAHPFDWMEDGRLLWVDEGNLLVANVDGSERIELSAPIPMHEVWLGANNIAMASAEGRLWRVDVLQDKWEEVTGIPDLYNLSIVNNGTAAILVFHDNAVAEYWYIPLAFGSSARLSVSGKFWGGSGARTPARTRPPNCWTSITHCRSCAPGRTCTRAGPSSRGWRRCT